MSFGKSTVALSFALLACGEQTPVANPVPETPSASVVATASAPTVAEVKDAAPPVAEVKATPLADLQLAALKAAADAINRHDGGTYSNLFTQNVLHKEAAAKDIVGRRDVASRMGLLFQSFPDLKLSFDHVWQKGNIAVATWRWTGTDRGGFMGKKPTGRHAGVQGVSVAFFNTDGLIREIHMYEDGQNLVSQLEASAKGQRPPPADSAATLEVTASVTGPDEDKGAATAKLFYDAVEAKKEADSAALFADDATVDDFGLSPRTGTGPTAWKALLKSWTTTFGSFTELPLYNLMAVKDYVIAERVLKGTMASSGVNLHAIDIAQLKDGKIVHLWSWSNGMELVSQIGPRGIRKG